MSDALQIAKNFVVINENLRADVVPVDEELYAKLDETYAGFAGHSLISFHTFDSNWPTWEVHPHGDEFVSLVSGRVSEPTQMLFVTPGEGSVNLEQPPRSGA